MLCIWRITIRIWNAYTYQRRSWRSFIDLLMNILASYWLIYETLHWLKEFLLTSLILLSPSMTSTLIWQPIDSRNHGVHPSSTLDLWPMLPVNRGIDRKSTRLNSSHSQISYAVFCLKKKNN